MGSPFTDRLPVEIRNEIYKHLLRAEDARYYDEDLSRDPKRAKLSPRFSFQCAILRTNRKIYDEAVRVLYHENLFVRLSSSTFKLWDWLKHGGIPALLGDGRSSKAQSIEYCAMSVTLEDDHGDGAKEELRWHCVITLTDLGSFCQFVLYQNAVRWLSGPALSSMAIEVVVHHQCHKLFSSRPASTSVQCRLLEPFAALHSVSDIKITGNIDTEYKNSIIAKVGKPGPSVEETVAKTMNILREARMLGDLGYHALALEKYKFSMIQTYSKNRYLTRHNILQTGLLAGRSEWFAFKYLEFIIECNLAICHAALEEWEEAHFWAFFAVKLGFFTPGCLKAQIVYFTAAMNCERDERVPVLEKMVESLEYLPCGRYNWGGNIKDFGKRMKIAKVVDSIRALKETIMTKEAWLDKCETEMHALLDRERTRTLLGIMRGCRID